jgi:hypothetical protein
MKSHYSESTGYRCDICRRTVDHDVENRARRGWQPLVICDRCVREAQTSARQELLAA